MTGLKNKKIKIRKVGNINKIKIILNPQKKDLRLVKTKCYDSQ